MRNHTPKTTANAITPSRPLRRPRGKSRTASQIPYASAGVSARKSHHFSMPMNHGSGKYPVRSPPQFASVRVGLNTTL